MSEEQTANPILGGEGAATQADVSVAYSEMPFADLRKLAKERGLDSKGTADEIVNRLDAYDVAVKAMPNRSTDPAEHADAEEDDAPVHTPAQERNIEQMYRTTAMKQKAYFDAQPKVSVLIPFEFGENPAQAARIPFIVNVNGYQYDIPRGVMVEVPKGVAEIVKDRLESEGKLAREYAHVRLDSNPDKATALQA